MFPPVFDTLRGSGLVVSLLGDVPMRCYRHGQAPQAVAKPYVTWQIVSPTPENTLSELPSIDRVQVQLDCWSDDDAAVTTLAVAVRDAIEPYAHMTGGASDDYEPATKLYRVALQFDWWLPRTEVASFN
jgi:hypothetical protein